MWILISILVVYHLKSFKFALIFSMHHFIICFAYPVNGNLTKVLHLTVYFSGTSFSKFIKRKKPKVVVTVFFILGFTVEEVKDLWTGFSHLSIQVFHHANEPPANANQNLLCCAQAREPSTQQAVHPGIMNMEPNLKMRLLLVRRKKDNCCLP